jgi:hypothetical protein
LTLSTSAYGWITHILPAGFAKLGYPPGDKFMGLFVRTCTAMQLEGFDPQALALIINGELYGLRPVNETWKSV